MTGDRPRAALISTYELGRQPFALASPAAWLERAGVEVTCLDLSREPFRPEVARADLVALHLPMHTAARLAMPVIRRIRRLNPDADLCCYGLYAPPNASVLRSLGVRHILGGEFEADLVGLALGPRRASRGPLPRRRPGIAGRPPHLRFLPPLRTGLPPLRRYAALCRGSARRVAGYTEASRGCRHHCRHCPIVPVYQGQLRVVPVDVVVADVEAQVRAGAEHVTFGDPDFFNAPRHALQVAEGVARACPGITYDVTIKVEHLLQHAAALPRLRETGCLFVTSAFESFDDCILARLDKGHTGRDAEQAVALCRSAGIALAPTFVAFTPWTTREGYCNLLAEIARLGLIDHVAPVQLAIRLLVPAGSRLLGDELGPYLDPYDAARLVYPWRHPDPEMDRLAERIGRLVARRRTAPRAEVFREVWRLAHPHEPGPLPRTPTGPRRRRSEVPYLDEPWYC